MNESESIVTCKDIGHPNFQIWGALSDLNCKKKNYQKPRKMELDFKSWLSTKEPKNKK